MEKPFGEPHSWPRDKQSHPGHLLRRRPTAGLEGPMENLLAKVSTKICDQSYTTNVMLVLSNDLRL